MNIDKYLNGSDLDRINMYLDNPHKYHDIFSKDTALNALSNAISAHLYPEIKSENTELMNFILSKILNIKDITVEGYAYDIYAVLHIDKPIKFKIISNIYNNLNDDNLYIVNGHICYNLYSNNILQIDSILFKSAIKNFMLDIYNIKSLMEGYDKYIFPDGPIEYLLFKLYHHHILNRFLKATLDKHMIQTTHVIEILNAIKQYIGGKENE